MALTIAQFVNKWKIFAQSESAGSHSHFDDLCEVLGEKTPAESDSVGERYAFEKHVGKTRGGKGFADVWMRDHFAWEYKGKLKDLKKAYNQLNDYREELGNPPLLVVCDLERFEVHTNFTKTNKRVYAFNLDDLNRNQVTASCPLPPLDVLRALFGDCDVLRPERTDAYVTQEAAKLFSRLAERLELENRNLGASREEVAHFLMRLLFCLFADAIGLLPNRLFRNLLTSDDRMLPKKFLRKLKVLFEAMSEPDGIFGEHTIKYFNGDLFNSSSVIQLDVADLGILYEVAKNYDWSRVAPAIFGTLFERSLDPKRRSLIGAHYTSEEDILLLIEPVVMRPLERRWESVKAEILLELGREEPTSGAKAPGGSDALVPGMNPRPTLAAKATPRPVLKAKAGLFAGLGNRAEELLGTWIEELTSVRVLDPACGSGNFLYVALRRMLDLWLEAQRFAAAEGIALAVPKMVSPTQLFGIETEFYAHELASIVVWIGFLQWKHEHGVRDDREPILEKLKNIEYGDAIMRYDAEGKPYEPEWPRVDFIVGNPPFLGDKKMRAELDTAAHPSYTDDLRKLYEGRVPGGADLVTFWFERARALVEGQGAKRVGLLATNSISMVGNRPVLERIKGTGDIFMAWSDRPWTLSGAAVRVSMLGFDNGSDAERSLDGVPVAEIHADLTAQSNVVGALRLEENEGLCFLGMMKGGPFDLEVDEAKKMLSRPLNPNGRPNSDVVRRRLGGRDVTGRDRGGWVIDFGVSMTESEAALYEWPFEYVKKHVKPLRDLNRRTHMREKWWIHGEARPGLRRATASLWRFAVTPEVSKYRLFIWVDSSVVPDHKLHVFARADDYFFGVLHSTVHEAWTIATCSWIGKGNDPSYNSDTTFLTFAFPWPPGTEPSEDEDARVKAIADAARELVRLRDAWLNPLDAEPEELKLRTLTNLYNKRPEWLAQIHARLDAAVFAGYGWPSDLGKEAILARLLELNHARAAAQTQGQ